VRIIEQMTRLAHRAEGAATTPDLSALFFELHPYAYNLMRLVNTPSDAEFESFAAMIEREAERGVVFDHIAHQYVAAALAFPGKLNIVKIALKLELVALDSHLKTARSGYPRKDAIGSMGEIVTAASASAMNCLNHIEDLSIHLAVDDPDRPAFAEAVARAREQLSAPAFVFDARTSAGAEGAARIVTLELRDRAEGDVMILSLSGRLDANTSPLFSAQWQTSRGQGFSAFVVDLAGLDYISSMGLRVLLVAAKQSKVVVCSMSPLVQKIFDLGGFARYMKTAGSIEQALALIRGD
jgi:anti-anti-sigma factor